MGFPVTFLTIVDYPHISIAGLYDIFNNHGIIHFYIQVPGCTVPHPFTQLSLPLYTPQLAIYAAVNSWSFN